MDTGLEHACQLLMAAAQSKSFIPCRAVFDLMHYSSADEKFEKINEVLHLCGMRAIRVKHKGVYCLSVVDAIEKSEEYYQWLRGALSPTNLKDLNEERGAYILIRILLHHSQQECDIDAVLDILADTADPPGWQRRQSDQETNNTQADMSASIRQAWLETIERFVAKGWLLQNDARLTSTGDMPQILISAKEISKFIADVNHGAK